MSEQSVLNPLASYGDAVLLADKLRAYWAKEGKAVRVWVDVDKVRSRPVYMVRSNMVNGLPRAD